MTTPEQPGQPPIAPATGSTGVTPPASPVSPTYSPVAEPSRPQWAAPPPNPATPDHWLEPVVASGDARSTDAGDAQRDGARPRSLVGPLLAVALVAALITSFGQYLVFQAAGAFAPAASPAAVTGQPVSQTSVQLDEESAVIRAAAAVSPAIVTITSRTGDLADTTESDPFSLPATGVGSGIIYDAAGWILTNRHVVAGSDSVTVKLKDGREFEGSTYGIDTLTDLAIVRIEGSDLPVAPLGDSTTLEIGQLAIAIGSPLGDFENSVTTGV
ncbi:MAG: S1C family serine protease, partial [Candidatus Limnocylindrales bacterium]